VNLVGKAFIVSIFVMSLVFMAFAIALYATNKNWREIVINEQAGPEKPLGLAPQLRKEQTDNDKLKKDLKDLTEARDAAKNAEEQALAKLESELEVMTKERQDLEAASDALQKKMTETVAAMNVTQSNTVKSREEINKLRTQISETQKARDDKFKEILGKTDELNQALIEKERLEKRAEDLGKDLEKAKKLH
jgi:chromosome segregation ATPase